MVFKLVRYLCWISILLLTFHGKTRAVETNQGPVFTLIEENDLVVDTDRHYTQGIKLAFLHADNDSPRWMKRLFSLVPHLGYDEQATKFGYEIGQSIFTPANIKATDVQSNDRPYAGWLYTGLIFQRRGLAADRFPTLEHFQLDLGIIGPESLADKAQTWVHEVRGFDTPQGWGNQLHDEPGFAAKYQRLWLFSPEADNPRHLDFIPALGLSLGNVETSFRAAATVRMGLNLPDDFGPQTISSLMTSDGGWSPTHAGPRWGIYFFSGIEGSAVAYSTFLNGNLYQSSPHVDQEPFVAEWKFGAVLTLNRLEGGLTFVHRTREFIGQQRDNSYGSIYGKIKF
jgi:lipid A 3-O-deacylase